jgi:hypothetical protein
MTVMDDDIGSGVRACQGKETTEAAGGAGDQDSFGVQRLFGHGVDSTACRNILGWHLTRVFGGDNILITKTGFGCYWFSTSLLVRKVKL